MTDFEYMGHCISRMNRMVLEHIRDNGFSPIKFIFPLWEVPVHVAVFFNSESVVSLGLNAQNPLATQSFPYKEDDLFWKAHAAGTAFMNCISDLKKNDAFIAAREAAALAKSISPREPSKPKRL